MKKIFVKQIMVVIRSIVLLIEKLFKISISKHPLEKFYGDFIEVANLDLVSQSKGVLHIGAHLGLESKEYANRGKSVIWVEADPDTFQKLERNLVPFDDQIAYNFVLGDEEKDVKFFRASNDSQSSSVFSFAKENSFKNVSTEQVLDLKMTRLDKNFTFDQLGNYDHWIIDVQGAELLVLKGAGDLLSLCQTLFIECSKDDYYIGGVQWNELNAFLTGEGFRFFLLPTNLNHINVIFFRVTDAGSNKKR